jgi:hypothetical protein
VSPGTPRDPSRADEVRLATAELLGALTYGQLRAWTTAVALVPYAPDLQRTDRVVGFADRERERYRAMRERLTQLTDLPAPVLERQKPTFDRFFDAVEIDGWLSGVAFLAVGLPLAADFARAVAPTVDEPTAEVLVVALAGRDRTARFALDELQALLDDAEHHDRARKVVADVIGAALTEFTGSLQSTDALRILFERHAEEQAATAESVVKRMAIDVLEAHRRRMHELGLEDLD